MNREETNGKGEINLIKLQNKKREVDQKIEKTE